MPRNAKALKGPSVAGEGIGRGDRTSVCEDRGALPERVGNAMRLSDILAHLELLVRLGLCIKSGSDELHNYK